MRWWGRGLRQLGARQRAPPSVRSGSGAGMPKKAAAPSKGQRRSGDAELPPGPVTVDAEGRVTVAVRAKPGSRRNAVTGVTAEAVGVAVAAPPSEGEANAELCRYLARVLALRKSDVVLAQGGRSREKVVKLLASTTPEEILEKLKKQVEKE
ncbi:UPF0235 protein C15orf40 homolog [Erinaceus europaeus]|uniref:UPF0235 protein C15orf40 homolog n=1 Tax=Erinaceus europaeus TaxID=9365 RepID=A0ABM3WG32_ERIEU|nr:UPF0235 protein C15orf40 homolog [Erinaceus europaeus]